MHELALVTALVDRVEAAARREGFSHVLEIRLAVGALSGVEPECVAFCFPAAARGTVLEGARLHQERVAAAIECRACGYAGAVEDPAILLCPACASGEVRVSAGREFRIVDLDVY